jgi:hypothetical protein
LLGWQASRLQTQASKNKRQITNKTQEPSTITPDALEFAILSIVCDLPFVI